MDIEADIIEFKVPIENNKTLFVWDILPTLTEAFIYESIWNIFSDFGALYLVKVCQNAAVAEPGFYAIVKFYSSAQASRAQRATQGKGLFQKSPLKGLSNYKCQELANYYLGFNGWSSQVVTLQDISSTDGAADAGAGQDSQALRFKYGCIIELSFPNHNASCRGVGVAEQSYQNFPGHMEVCLMRGKLQKCAKNNALSDAFRKVLLVLLSNGRVVVECKFDPDEILPDEDLTGVIKVSDISWDQFENMEEEDFLSELTLNMSN
ncbi:hypothetical protein JZ751_013207 [Albula glossodonta]|uniref:RAD52 motif-containing protein 1 n=1 Tax=Albula glossodonta TaxID=121402 RepID=A0A8T2NWE3_9TELE|nr:hypothetical protein JZ751_013207 [Albula glossodonta]